MTIRKSASLSERRNDLTRQVILQAAIDMLEHAPLSELTVRAVAHRANVSERTVFRYFASREDFLDAVALEMGTRLALPPAPQSLQEARTAAKALYEAFEQKVSLIKASLHSEIYDRMRRTSAKERWQSIRKLIDAAAAHRSKREREIAAANICYFLTASTWHYYRFYFGMSLEESIACAEGAIAQAIDEITR